MILGIGIDIIEIDRIEKSIENYKEHFLNKIYTQTELDYSMSKKNRSQHLAARFAAKEAIIKALSSVHSTGINWKDIEIYNEPNGQPQARLTGKLSNILIDNRELKITMSHSENYVTCFAILHLTK